MWWYLYLAVVVIALISSFVVLIKDEPDIDPVIIVSALALSTCIGLAWPMFLLVIFTDGFTRSWR